MPHGLGRLGVICTPGSYTGAFSVGYLKALEEAGLEPDVYQGSSAGVLNALGFVNHGADELIDVWKYIEEQGPEFLYSSESTWKLLKDLVNHKPLYRGDGLRRLVHMSNYEEVDNELPELRIIVFNESENRVEIVSSRNPELQNNPGMFKKFILASCSPPGVFPPVEIKGSVYTDAVFFSVEDLVYQGCDTVFVFFNDVHNIAEGTTRSDIKNWWLQKVIGRRHDYKDYVDYIRKDLMRYRDRCAFFRMKESVLSANKFKKGDITRAIETAYERGSEILKDLNINPS